MRITCEHCQRSFNLPEDKVPQGNRFRFSCPVCQETNQIHIAKPEKETGEITTGDVKTDDVSTVDAPPVQAPPGARLALVVIGAERAAQRVGLGLQDRGWQVIEAQSPRMGKAYLQAYRLELVVMEDSDPGREVLAEIHRLPGRERREMNCVLIGDRTASFDTLTAFVLGVNSYVHQDDSQGLETALDQAEDLFHQYRRLWMTAGNQ